MKSLASLLLALFLVSVCAVPTFAQVDYDPLIIAGSDFNFGQTKDAGFLDIIYSDPGFRLGLNNVFFTPHKQLSASIDIHSMISFHGLNAERILSLQVPLFLSLNFGSISSSNNLSPFGLNISSGIIYGHYYPISSSKNPVNENGNPVNQLGFYQQLKFNIYQYSLFLSRIAYEEYNLVTLSYAYTFGNW